MDKRFKFTFTKVNNLVKKIVERLNSREDFKYDDLWILCTDSPKYEDFNIERKLLKELCDVIKSSNPVMVSDRSVIDRILYGIIGQILSYPKTEDEIHMDLEKKLRELIYFQSSREVDIPLINIDVESKPFVFGPVTFFPFTENDKNIDDWWPRIKSSIGESNAFHQVVSYAKVISLGDQDLSINSATEKVEEALLLLRAICFPIRETNIPQIGIISNFHRIDPLPLRLHPPKANYRIEHPSEDVTVLGTPLAPYYLYQDLLLGVNKDNLDLFINLIKDHGFYPKDNIAKKFLMGLRWIGEATKPDRISARFVKLAFGLETIIGGDPGREFLPTPSLTATLAERSAFLVGDSLESRKLIEKEIREYLEKGVNKANLSKIYGVSWPTIDNFIKTRKLTK